jgi:hypothetical protein
MSQLDSIVRVSITESSDTVAQASFDLIMIVGDNPTFSGRTKLYGASELDTLASELSGGATDPEYLMAQAIFGQNPRVTQVKVGKIEGGDANLTASLTAIQAADPNWYGFATTTRTKADQLLAAAFSESNKKLYIAASAEADIVDTTDVADTTSLAAEFKDNAYRRSSVVYLSTAASAYPDAALLGKILPFTPGSYTAQFKALTGVSVDNLTVTQVNNANDKNANVYIEIGGRNMVKGAKVGSGSFIDTIVFIDWIESRTKENVFLLLARNKKLPYTNIGITAIDKEVRAVLKRGQDNGGISPTEFDEDGVQIGGYFTSVPALAEIPNVDKASRILRNVKFTAFLAGAIHETVIEGLVTV